ncbi:MAG: hypothetical protein APR55_02230 [Methanolinea sp. SDB]|nr:MAG: hypothetical protein APR55_02230 [Methanolinea sp. SDB]
MLPEYTPAGIFEVDTISFIEPSYSDLIDEQFTYLLTTLEADQGRLLIDEESDPLALAVLTSKGWFAGSFHLRHPTASLIEYFESLGGDIYQEDRDIWERSVREYYSLIIRQEVVPALEDVNPERVGMIDSLLEEIWGDRSGAECLDCCCGSGVGSMALRNRGLKPISFDIDAPLLSLGFHTGRLRPEETMRIDGSMASRFIGQTEGGLGLMFGEFNEFNRETWEMITSELISLTEWSLITVGTEREAEQVARWGESRHRVVEVQENTRDPIYDRFVCIIEEEN